MATSDDYARTIISVGQAMGISVRGIIIGLATSIVEVGYPLRNYANEKVPESLRLPHDAVGRDGFSVGLFQQQIVKTANGYWWADTATCMDPASAARLFFGRLRKLDYENTIQSPGHYAQAVQGSSFPDRYDTRMAEAAALYNRLTPNPPKEAPVVDYGITKVMHGYNATSDGIGNSNGPRGSTPYFVVHTQQAKSKAVNLAEFCNNSATTSNPVAYNLAIDGRETVEIVPLNEGPWSAGDANNIGIHACVAGSFAEWSRGQWLDDVDDSGDGWNENDAITRLAKAAAAAHLEYGIPLEYAGDQGQSGWPVKPRGIVGHMDFGQRGGGHTDPGAYRFPFDELIRRAWGFVTPAAPPPNLINQAAEVAKAWIGKALGDETAIPGGAFRAYENGHVYWRAGDQAAYVIPHGGLFEAYMEYGFETGLLSWPRREFAKVDGGAVQAFWGGVLLRKDGADHGYPVRGVIGDRYAKEGYETGDLGWPVSDEYNNGTGGLRQDFENGVLMFDGSGSPKILKGDK